MTIDTPSLDLAREWAGKIAIHHPLISPDRKAAAEIITALPDEWVDADKLREVIGEMRENIATAQGTRFDNIYSEATDRWAEQLESLLPTPPLPTLADMDVSERHDHKWCQCDVKGQHFRHVLISVRDDGADLVDMNGLSYSFGLAHVTPRPDLKRMVWPDSEPEETHFDDLPVEVKQVMEESVEDYEAGRFVDFDAPEQARPEDVKPGEVWEMEFQGRRYVAMRNREPAPNWVAMRLTGATGHGAVFGDNEITLLHRLVPEQAPLTSGCDDNGARMTLEQVAEADPAYIYTDSDGDEWEHLDGRWTFGGTHAERVAKRKYSFGRDNLPEVYGPYTRIEETNE